MPKYIYNVAENWSRKYIIEAESEEDVSRVYRQWATNPNQTESVKQLSDPEYIDDGPESACFVEGLY